MPLTSFLIDGCGAWESSAPNTYRGSVRQKAAGAAEPELNCALETDLCPRAGLLKEVRARDGAAGAPRGQLSAGSGEGQSCMSRIRDVVWEREKASNQGIRLPVRSRLELSERARPLPSGDRQFKKRSMSKGVERRSMK